MLLPPAGIVSIGSIFLVATHAREMTHATTNHGAEQVRVSCIVAASILLVVGKLALHQIKLFLRDNRRNIGYRFPLLRLGGRMTSVVVTDWSQSGLPMLCSGDSIATNIDGSCVNRIAQDATHRGSIPAQLPCGSGNFLFKQGLGQPDQTLVFLLISLEQIRHHSSLRRFHPHTCRVTRMLGIDPIAIRRGGPGQQEYHSKLLLTTASHAFSDQAAFVFGYRATDLDQQLVMRIVARRLIEKLDLASTFFKLFHE